MRVGPAFLQTFLSQVIQSIASIATGILIARALGPLGQGQYALVATAVALAVVLASFGQFEGNVLSSAGSSDPGRVLLVRSIIHCSLVAALLLLSMPLWRSGMGASLSQYIPLLFTIILALEVEAALIRGINLGQHHIAAYNIAMLVQRFAYLALVGGLWAVRSMSVERVLTMWALAVLGSVALSGSWIWIRSQPAAIDMRTLTTQWTSNVKKGVRALVTISVTLVLVRCDVWMLGPILGVQAVGQVSIASSLAEWLWYVPSILGNLLFAAAAAGTGDHTVRQITRASRAVVTLVVPTTVVLMLLGRHVVPLIYGEAFRPAGTLFVILLPGMAAVAIHLVVDAYFSGKGFPPISVWSAIGALVAKVGLNVLVIHKYGMVGAVAVTSTVYIGLLGVKLVAFAWETGTSPRAVLVPRWDELLGNIAAARSWVLGRLRAA